MAQACGGTYLFAAEPGPKSEGEKGLGIDEFFLNLAEIYRIVGTEVAGQNEVLSERGVTNREEANIHNFYVDAGASELVAAVRWRFGNPLILLRDPIGGVHTIPFTEIADHHKVFRIGAPIPGMWQFELTINPAGGCQEFCESYYLVEASVKSILTMELYLALPLEERIVGTPMPILVSLTDTGPIKNATVRALVTNPNGVETLRTLYDDGAHGDGGPDDGIYGNKYYGTGLEGTYQVVATAEGTSDALGQFTRRRTKAFHMVGGKDSDDDRMPDEYEILFPCLNPGENDAKADKDQDGLDNIAEFQIGTNPCDPDTDDGGESDGSEASRQADPFDPRDDRAKPPRIRVIPGVLKILVRFNIPFIGRDIAPPDKFNIYRCDPGSEDFNLIFSDWPAEPPFQFVDEAIQEGLNYKYRIVARGSNNEESCPSNVEDATGTRDPYPPHGSIFINMGAMTTSSLDVELTLIAEDNFEPEFDLDPRDAHDPMAEVSGVADMMIMNHSDGSDGLWEPFNPTRPWMIEPNAMGIATVFVKYRDNAGNVSAMYHATITVVEAPTPTETEIEPTATETPEPTETDSPVPTETETETPAETATPTCNVQDSDFDFDGMNGVDARDLLLCLAGIQQGSPFRDFNCDGKMDMEDLFLMARKWKIELP
ncbi:MAG: hypothetical protein HUU16_16700 [Candidatus Omnitrophica bacterium]|nr:hypothetical protein [Candidatus Omnitrophota bacterium]